MGSGAMRRIIALNEANCLVDDKGDVIIRLPAFYYIYLFVSAAAVLVFTWIWIRGVFSLIIILSMAETISAIVWLGSWPYLKIDKGAGMIAWLRWYRKRNFSIGDTSELEINFEKKIYAWSAHLVDRNKKVLELKVVLTLCLKDGSRLYLGKVTGENSESRALSIAQAISNAIGVPVNKVGCI
jgi:hypothetical protein